MQDLQLVYCVYQARYFYPVLIAVCTIPVMVNVAVTFYLRHKKIMALMNQSCLTPIVQQQWVRATASFRLVPGDVVVLQRGRAVCDMVLLQGACLVTESMMSGEVTLLSFVCKNLW